MVRATLFPLLLCMLAVLRARGAPVYAQQWSGTAEGNPVFENGYPALGVCDMPYFSGVEGKIAIPYAQFDHSNKCGACVKVWALDKPEKTFVLQVVDAKNALGDDVEMGTAQFSLLGGRPTNPRVSIGWSFTPCPVKHGIKYGLATRKSPENKSDLIDSLTFTNTVMPIVKVELFDRNSKRYAMLPRAAGSSLMSGKFTTNALPNEGVLYDYPLNVRITSCSAERIIFEIPGPNGLAAGGLRAINRNYAPSNADHTAQILNEPANVVYSGDINDDEFAGDTGFGYAANPHHYVAIASTLISLWAMSLL